MQDKLLTYSEEQAETTVAAHDSTNTVDLGLNSDYGERGTLWLVCKVVETFTSGGSATLAVAFQDSADNSSFAAVANAPSKAATAVASLVAGYELLRFKLPPGVRQYSKLVYTIGTAVMTAGKVSAYLEYGSETP